MIGIRRVYYVSLYYISNNFSIIYSCFILLGGYIMKIKRIQIKAYYSYCSKCGRSIDSNDSYYYDGLCEYCWRTRNYE